jgi:NAD+ diphosphatase
MSTFGHTTQSIFIPTVAPLSRAGAPPEPGYTPEPGYWFVLQKQRLVTLSTAELPFGDKLDWLSAVPRYDLGQWDGRPCYAVRLADNAPLPDGYQANGLRGLWAALDETAFWIAGRAAQLLSWEENHQFCGRCAAPLRLKGSEWAKECPACGRLIYPNPFPAIITLVQRDDQILLARSHRYPTGRYSVLAGFVEVGESLETAVRREIREETGIEVADIRYFGSQPWPFPNSLMIAFACRYASGDICLEEAEIADAQWFTADNLPDIPPPLSIARQLIDWFVAQSRL